MQHLIAAVNLLPDNHDPPRRWASDDLGAPSVLFYATHDGTWFAQLERTVVARGRSAEELAALVYGEFGLLPVLVGHGAA